jgi:hypothetical protein
MSTRDQIRDWCRSVLTVDGEYEPHVSPYEVHDTADAARAYLGTECLTWLEADERLDLYTIRIEHLMRL